MANSMVIALSQHKDTFKSCRYFIYELLGKDKVKLEKLENSIIEICIPYYIGYIESTGINFNEAINYYAITFPDKSYWDIIKITIVNVFNKIENKDLNFIPY